MNIKEYKRMINEAKLKRQIVYQNLINFYGINNVRY